MSEARWRCARRRTSSRCARRGPARSSNVTVSPHHGMPAMAHTGAARAAVEALTRELAESLGSRRRLRRCDRDRAVRHRVAAQVPGGAVAHARRRRCRYSAWARSRSTAGSSRCSHRRSADRSPARSSRSTEPLDNWTGPWPPEGLASDGEVPTEERAARTRARARTREVPRSRSHPDRVARPR